jgi:hypothetical protein
MPLTDEQARAQAEAEVRAYCGWHIFPAKTEDLVVDGSHATVQMLPTLRLTAVHGVEVDGTAVDLGTVEWSVAGFLRRDAAWTSRLRGVVVSVTHGYDAWPPDVEAVLTRMAAQAVETSDASQLLAQVGQVRYAVGPDGLRNVGLMSTADAWVLDRYRLPPRP